MSKIVRHIDGHLVMRPAVNHPHPAHWSTLKDEIRDRQRTADGKVHCGTCWTTEDQGPLDLHHRHYDNFGAEQPEDVVLLCRQCHEYITSRIRSARFALGDRSEGMAELTANSTVYERVRFEITTTRPTTVEFTSAETVDNRFRPNTTRNVSVTHNL